MLPSDLVYMHMYEGLTWNDSLSIAVELSFTIVKKFTHNRSNINTIQSVYIASYIFHEFPLECAAFSVPEDFEFFKGFFCTPQRNL